MKTPPVSAEAVAERLAAAFGRHFAEPAAIEGLRRLTGGAASATWSFDARSGAGNRRSILRASQGAETISTGVDKGIEARVQQAAFEAGVAVARILFVLTPEDGLGQGFVMERVEGESIPQKILRDPRFEPAIRLMTGQCAGILGRIHRVDTAALADLPHLTAADQIAQYEQIYRDTGQQLPCFEIALRWLHAHAPASAGVPQLVHGDFRMGNFLVDPDTGITAVLDWELSHRGDPMEDLGWLCVNSWRFGERDKPVGGFGTREELYSAYADATGVNVDPRRVHFWETFGVFKWGVICMYMTGGHLSGEERSVERAAIGRRVSETEIDLLQLLAAAGD